MFDCDDCPYCVVPADAPGSVEPLCHWKSNEEDVDENGFLCVIPPCRRHKSLLQNFCSISGAAALLLPDLDTSHLKKEEKRDVGSSRGDKS